MISSSSSEYSRLLAGFPSSSATFTRSKSSSSFARDLSPFIAFFVRSMRRSIISTSEKISSRLIVSISRRGLMLPSTWVIFESSKHLTTCTIASTSRMCERNLFPRPSPFDAPLTRPAMSTNSMYARVTFLGLYISASRSTLSSGTSTMPTFGSIVQNG